MEFNQFKLSEPAARLSATLQNALDDTTTGACTSRTGDRRAPARAL